MRLLPRSRRVRVAVAVTLTVMALGAWVAWYRPWEAHYHGRPASRWAERYLTWTLCVEVQEGWRSSYDESWQLFEGPAPRGFEPWPAEDSDWSRRFRHWYFRLSPQPPRAPQPPWHRWFAAIGIKLDAAKRDGDPESWSLLRGDADAVPVLRELLHHPSPNVRLVAVYGLRCVWIKSPEAAAALASAASDGDVTVRVAARVALRAIDPDAAARAGFPVSDPAGLVVAQDP